MRFFTTTTAAALALVVSVSAQNSTSVLSTSTTASASPQQTCLAKCGAADICCQAACVNVPCPSQLQANATTECAASCPQGNGSYVETQKYATCQANCISSYFLSTSTAAASTATGSNSAYTFGSGATTTGSGSHSSATGSATASVTKSGSASSSSSTGNAAPETRAAIAGAGLLGLIVAGLML